MALHGIVDAVDGIGDAIPWVPNAIDRVDNIVKEASEAAHGDDDLPRSELERGKPTVALDKTLAVLAVLGLRVQITAAAP